MANTGRQPTSGSRGPEPGRDWPFDVRPLHPRFGCEIVGITLEQATGESIFAKVHEAFLDYELILFRAVDLPPATQVAFARRFGEIQIHPMTQYHGYGHPEIYLLSNLDAEGRPTTDPTAALGATFVGMQVFEWTKLIMEGVRPWENPWGAPQFGSAFFMITGFHGCHVTAGVIYLLITAKRVSSGFYDRKGSYETVEVAGLYWHFVDLVWVFIFAFFYLW